MPPAVGFWHGAAGFSLHRERFERKDFISFWESTVVAGGIAAQGL